MNKDKKIECCQICEGTDINLLSVKGIVICDECVLSLADIVYNDLSLGEIQTNAEDLDDLDKQEDLKIPENLLNPKKIKEVLDSHIIGQESAKKIISVAVYNHYNRLSSSKINENTDLEIKKSNVLLLGPSGSGKTLIAETISKMLNVPLVITDATSLTQAGYVGDDVEDILTRLVRAADGNIKKAEKGIVFIDEIDKIASSNRGPSLNKDVSGEGVQQSLLKIIEGTEVSFSLTGGRKHPEEENPIIDTKNILFICSGAFNGLEDIKKEREKGKGQFGFTVERKSKDDKVELINNINKNRKVNTEDLIKYGMIQEFIGRLPIKAQLDEIKEEDLIKILTEPKNSIINQYKELLLMDDVKLNFSKESISFISKVCLEEKTGARGLKTIIEDIMLDIVYEIDNFKKKSITVTEEYIKNRDFKELIKIKKNKKVD